MICTAIEWQGVAAAGGRERVSSGAGGTGLAGQDAVSEESPHARVSDCVVDGDTAAVAGGGARGKHDGAKRYVH